MSYLLIGMKREKVTSALGRPRAFDAEKALDRAMQVLAEGLPWHVAFRSHRCNGHQSSESLRRFW